MRDRPGVPHTASSHPSPSGHASLRRRILVGLALSLVVAPLAYLAVVRFVPPPGTLLMVVRSVQGEPWHWRWVAIDGVSPLLLQAVVASEDAKFCRHGGFDWGEMRAALRQAVDDGHWRGASTISMQTARNLMLWPGRDPLRKVLEAWFTVLLEAMWPKRRILEAYVNIAEWGPGIYGAEAAAQSLFAKSAARLTEREAALLAAVLPNPREWSAARPSAYISSRAAVIRARMRLVRLDRDHICP